MIKNTRRMIVLIVVIMSLLVQTIPVYAIDQSCDSEISTQASYYITSYSAGITGGSGSVTVDFDITGTGWMTSIGASRIDIYTAAGTVVKSFYATSTDGMLSTNRSVHFGTVTYNGAKSGTKYYAVVTFKASNSSGGDSRTFTTGYATAK